MNNITFCSNFKRKLKPLTKKYKTLRKNIENLGSQLLLNPHLGESYGENIYKIRLADESKGKGKSGGFRILYYLLIKNKEMTTIVLLTFYDKGELDTINKDQAVIILKTALKELE